MRCSRGIELGLVLWRGIEKGRVRMKREPWQDGARKISADRHFLMKNKIILLLGLDFIILHQ